MIFGLDEATYFQGRPVNVKHDARCVIGKVGGDKPKQGKILIYCYKFAVIGYLPLIIITEC